MTDNLRGIIAVLIASAAFVINDAIVKLVSAELPSGEIIVVRGVLATILLTAGVVALGATRPVSVLMTRMMLHAPCRGRCGHDFHRHFAALRAAGDRQHGAAGHAAGS